MSALSILNHKFTDNNDGPPILYLHGFLGCMDDWDEVIDRLGDRFSHLSIDLTGHGSGSKPTEEEHYSMPAVADSVIAVLDHCQLDRCHLVGYSMGGRLGLYLLVHYPERFTSAVIESASPGLRTDEERQSRQQHEQQLLHQLTEQNWDEFLKSWYNQPLFQTMDQSDPRFGVMLKRRRRSDPVALARSLQHMGTSVQPSLWESLGRSKCPVMFLAGEKDDKFQALSTEMASLCPAGRSTIIPEAGHNVHFERPAEFSRQINQFFGANK